MRIKCFVVLFLLLVSTAVACGYDKTRKETVPIDPDGEITIICPRGDIKIDTYSGNKIRLVAVLSSGTKDELETTVIPFNVDNKSFNILPGDKQQKPGVTIDYDLQVPKRLKSVNLTALGGNIKARGTFKQIKFKTVNGEIDFKGEFTGGNLSSANGDIELYAKKELNGDTGIQSTNGTVTVILPWKAAFRIDAITKTGAIQNDFSLPIKKETGGYTLKGTVKEGTHAIKINSVNGKIKLLKH